MAFKLTLSSPRLPFGRLQRVDWSSLLYHEENIGGLAISEAGLSLTYLARRQQSAQSKILLEKESALPPGTIEVGALKKGDALEKSLRELIKGVKLPSQSVVLALPSTVCQPFVFEFLPSLRPEEITSAISLIVDSSLPLPRPEIYADWEEIRAPVIGKRKFILAMGLKELVDPYVAVVRKVGLVPVAVETHGWSLPRSLALQDKTALTTNFEPSQAIFSVYVQNALVFQFDLPRHLPTVPSPPPPALSSETAPAKQDKRARKKKLEAVPIATSPLPDFYEQAALFAERINHFLLSDPEYNTSLEKILVLAPLKEREDFMARVHATLKDRIGPEVKDRPLLLLSRGAARRGLLPRREDTISSLLPIGTELAYERARALSFLDFFQKLVIALGGFFILLFAGSLLLVNIIARNTDRALERQQVSIPQELGVIRAAAQTFNQEVMVLSAIQKRTPNWERVFGDLGFLSNPGLSITTFDLSLANPLTVAGSAKSRDALLQLKATLENHPTFSPVTLPLSILLGKENLPFSLKVDFKNRGIFYP